MLNIQHLRFVYSIANSEFMSRSSLKKWNNFNPYYKLKSILKVLHQGDVVDATYINGATYKAIVVGFPPNPGKTKIYLSAL